MRINRTAGAVLVLFLSAALLTGCGSDSDDKDAKASQPKVLTEDDLESALLRAEDVGADYRTKADDEEDDEPAPGCLKGLDVTNDGFPGSDEDTEISIEADTEDAIPEASQLISYFKDESAASKALDDLAGSLSDCSTVKETDPDGTVYAIDVTTSTDPAGDRVSDQFNLDTVGTITTQGQSIPVSIRVRFARIGSVITGVAITGIIDTDTAEATDDLTDVALERLTALLDGKDQPEPDPIDLPVYTG